MIQEDIAVHDIVSDTGDNDYIDFDGTIICDIRSSIGSCNVDGRECFRPIYRSYVGLRHC